MKTLNRRTIRGAAYLAALTEYRAAFKMGKLGEVHTNVVDEVYGIAADELMGRANVHRRSARWRLAIALSWFVSSFTVLFALNNLPRLAWVVWLPVYFVGVGMFERYARADAFRQAARLLDRPPYERRVPAPAVVHVDTGEATS